MSCAHLDGVPTSSSGVRVANQMGENRRDTYGFDHLASAFLLFDPLHIDAVLSKEAPLLGQMPGVIKVLRDAADSYGRQIRHGERVCYRLEPRRGKKSVAGTSREQ